MSDTKIKKTGTETEHLVRRNPDGFGYEVMKKVTDYDKNKVFRTIVFKSADSDQCKRVKSLLDSDQSISEEKPNLHYSTRILIFEEKHGDRFFLVSSVEEFHLACKKIFDQRVDQGWYNWITEEEEPTMPDFAEETIPSLPESMRTEAKNTWTRYKNQLASYKDNQHLLKIMEIAKGGDAAACCEVLKELKGNEYEKFRFEDPESYR